LKFTTVKLLIYGCKKAIILMVSTTLKPQNQ
jgi:hypothetical protein